MIFERQIKFLNELEKQQFQILMTSVNQHDEIIKNYIVELQLFKKGVDRNEKRLKGYAPSTIRYKIRKGQPFDRTTTRDEGDLHASFTVEAFPDYIQFSSDVSHAKYVVQRYGENIFKPTLENMKSFFEKFFIPDFKNYINGQFAK